MRINFFHLNLTRRKLTVFVHDLLWVPAALYLAYALRFNLGEIPAANQAGLLIMLAVAIPVHAILFWRLGLYRGIWRFASIPDLIRISKSIVLGVLATLLFVFIAQRFEGVPRSVMLLYPLLLALGLTAPRVFYRWIKDHRLAISRGEGQRALIVGAGRAGELMARNLLRGGQLLPVAFVDPDPGTLGTEIHGIRVVAGLEEISGLIRKLEIEIVLLAMPEAPASTLSDIVKSCAEAKIPCRTIPLGEDAEGAIASENRLRPVTIEDLLYREPVRLDTEAVAAYLRGRRVLVTGGGGSIGSELCRQIAAMRPESLLVLERTELNLYEIEHQLRRQFPALQLHPILGDVRDKTQLEILFRQHRPQVVFHAAAYKHVPIIEANPAQGVLNNVTGTRLVAELADAFAVERFVLISTDKAVNPANVMGATKRVAEIYCQNLRVRSKTSMITTRFGNVLGSAGSVVPLFESQIAQGGPVTVTHQDMTRYFMTNPEAVSLILVAGSMGKGGEIFVLDMGEPVNLRDLAMQMIRLKGLEPERDIAITYIGVRPGEKLYEELFHKNEGLIGTNHPKLLLAAHREVDWEQLIQHIAAIEKSAEQGDVTMLHKQLKKIVPEFAPAPAPAAEAGNDADGAPVRLVKS